MWYNKHWEKCSKTKLWAYKYLGIWIIAFGSRMGPLWFSKVYHKNGKIGFANYLWRKFFWKNVQVAPYDRAWIYELLESSNLELCWIIYVFFKLTGKEKGNKALTLSSA